MAPFLDVEELTLRFLAVESISGNESAYAELVEGVLRELGLEPERQPVGPGRFNVAADAHGRSVLLCTHLDTVPPFLPVRSDDEAIHGRGACDTKGILAAMLGATQRLRADGIDDFGLLLVVGEEVDGAGAEAANLRYRSRYVVVGEPTEGKMARGHKGMVKFHLEARGRTGHSAYPETGHNALHDMAAVVTDLLATDFGYDDVLGPATFNVGRLEGGHAANVLADRAVAHCMLRSVGSIRTDCARIEEVVAGRAQVAWIARKEASRMSTLAGFETCVVSFSTDIPYLTEVGEPLLYGPGSILVAHTDHEHIRRDELRRAVDDYERIVRCLLEGRDVEPASVS